MFTEKHRPYLIAPHELDNYLSRGWYRMGQTIFTTHFLFYRSNLYSTIWTRLPLKDYKLRKRLRKIRNKNEREFRRVIRKAEITPEKENLYLKYQENFPEFRSPSVHTYMQDGYDDNIFNTYEACVYDGEELIAFSFFDVGKKSLASILGVYSPDYPSFSLGFYTMLLEIQYGLDNGFDIYYPGYIVPGRPKFDYKKRIGKPEEVQFFDLKTGNWHPFTEFEEDAIPIRKLSSKLGEIHTELKATGIQSQLLYYPSHHTNMPLSETKYRLDAPVFLNVLPEYFNGPRFIVSYDIWKEQYTLVNTMRLEDLAFQSGSMLKIDLKKHSHSPNALLKREVIAESKNVFDIVGIVWKLKARFAENPRGRFLKH